MRTLVVPEDMEKATVTDLVRSIEEISVDLVLSVHRKNRIQNTTPDPEDIFHEEADNTRAIIGYIRSSRTQFRQ